MKVILDDWGRNIRIYATLKNDSSATFNYKVQELWDKMERKTT